MNVLLIFGEPPIIRCVPEREREQVPFRTVFIHVERNLIIIIIIHSFIINMLAQ